jgi:hypothetical protein
MEEQGQVIRAILNGELLSSFWLLIPLKVVSDSDLIPVAASEVKPVVFGAKRRWRSYSA